MVEWLEIMAHDCPSGLGSRTADFLVSGMIYPIIGRNLGNLERVDPFKTPDVVPVLLGFGAPLVVRVDAAYFTEVMLGGVGVERVNPEMLGTFDDVKSAKWHGCDDRAAAPAVRAITAPRIHDPVGQVEQQLHRTTVTRSVVLNVYDCAANIFDSHFLMLPRLKYSMENAVQCGDLLELAQRTDRKERICRKIV